MSQGSTAFRAELARSDGSACRTVRLRRGRWRNGGGHRRKVSVGRFHGMLAAFQRSMFQHLATIDLDDTRSSSSSPTLTDPSPLVDQLLEVLSRSSTPATFFAPIHVARPDGAVLRRIASAGHEVACLTTTSPSGRAPYSSDFREHVRSTKSAIEDATGVRVRGHRATRFGVDSASEWAYDVLVDEGFEYDSSRFPTRNPAYGCAAVPPSVHSIRRWTGTLLEVPVTTTDVFAMRFLLFPLSPLASGWFGWGGGGGGAPFFFWLGGGGWAPAPLFGSALAPLRGGGGRGGRGGAAGFASRSNSRRSRRRCPDCAGPRPSLRARPRRGSVQCARTLLSTRQPSRAT